MFAVVRVFFPALVMFGVDKGSGGFDAGCCLQGSDG
jgi:hypothetical protein